MKKRKLKVQRLFFLVTTCGTIVAILLSVLIISGFFTKEVTVTKEVTKEVEAVDANNLFLGDSLTAYFDVQSAFEGMHVINSGIAGNTTTDLLNDMEARAYIYNPSKVFLLIGTNDLRDGKSAQETFASIVQVIEALQTNRPLASIVIESLYPVNATIPSNSVGLRTNEAIQEINADLQDYAKENDLTYIDLYSELSDDQGNLKTEYTVDGLHLSDEGYQVVISTLAPYLDD